MRPNLPPKFSARRRHLARPAAARRAKSGACLVDLALQGGGSHGAFTWGVLDRLLQDEGIEFSGVSGTSAGALNAAVLATGLAHGGRLAAREALTAFWRDVASDGDCFGASAPAADARLVHSPAAAATAGAAPRLLPLSPLFSPLSVSLSMPKWAEWMWLWPALLGKFASPYQLNPLGLNPLRSVTERHVDVAVLRNGPLKLFITATSVHTGQAEVFKGQRLSINALLASACLPHLFHAVVIDGEPYWDGGYTGNPALWPLIYDSTASDLLLVKINPLERRGTPDTPMEIADRISEITFNAGLTGELRAIAFVQKLLHEDRLQPGRYKSLRMHMVHDEDRLAALTPQSKLDTRWHFLQSLHAMGYDAAEAWLAQHRADLGVKPSLDIEKTFLSRRTTSAAKPSARQPTVRVRR